MAFVLVCWLVILVLAQTGVVHYHWGLATGAVIAGLVELVPLPLDDNLSIPLVSGAAMHFMAA